MAETNNNQQAVVQEVVVLKLEQLLAAQEQRDKGTTGAMVIQVLQTAVELAVAQVKPLPQQLHQVLQMAVMVFNLQLLEQLHTELVAEAHLKTVEQVALVV